MIKLTSLSKISRRGWLLVGLPVAVLAVVLPVYFVAASHGVIPPALQPAALIHNPVTSFAKTITGAAPTPTPSATPARTPTPGQVAGASTTAPGVTPSGKAATPVPTPAPSGDHLILAQSEITMAGGTIDTPNYRAWTTMKLASGANIYSPVITGPRTDVGVLGLPIVNECPASNGEWCTDWSIGAQRARPEGSGSAVYTITTHDQAGKTYSTNLTVKWLPIPYFYLAAGHVEIVSGSSVQWGNLVGIVVHATIEPSANFGNPKLQGFGASFPSDYPCMGTPSLYPDPYVSSRQYNGNNDVTGVCWMYPSQADTIRSHAATADVFVKTDLFTDFANQDVNVTIPAW